MRCKSSRTYQRPINCGQMANQKEPSSSLKHTSGFTVKRSKMIGTSGCHLQKLPITSGQMPQPTPPFNIIMGYTPRLVWNLLPSQIPAVEERLGILEEIRQEAFRIILKAQSIFHLSRKGRKRFKPYQEGDQVWIEDPETNVTSSILGVDTKTLEDPQCVNYMDQTLPLPDHHLPRWTKWRRLST